MAASQPIALPQPAHSHSHHAADYPMEVTAGSVGTPFNPASYTRHFLGTPLSWRTGSFGARFPQGSPSAQCLSSLDPSQTPPLDVMNTVNLSDREDDLCRNYICCGLHLQDLHALLEHFENVHVRRGDHPAAPPEICIPFVPQSTDAPQQQQQPLQPLSQHTQHLPPQASSFDTDDMELELDLDNSTEAPASSNAASAVPHATQIQQHPYSHYPSQLHSSQPSPYGSRPQSPSASHSISSVPFPHAGPGAPAVLTRPEGAFNSYAHLTSEYTSHIPGVQLNASSVATETSIDYPTLSHPMSPAPHPQQCIPPALLFAESVSAKTASSPVADVSLSRASSSRISSPPTVGPNPANKLKLKVRGHAMSASTPGTPTSSAIPSTSTSTPAHTPPHTPLPLSTATSSMLLSKPFRCPKPNCNKSYKQANGLKYHMTHGSCNFAPPKDLEHVKDLLEIKRRERERDRGSCSASTTRPPSPNGQDSFQMPSLVHPTYGDLGAITETELREVEREAEKRLRPFACGVGDCPRRYKNMNGLRYHYQHSGEHGTIGLALLAGGMHQCLSNGSGNGGNACDGQERSCNRDGKGKNGEEPDGRKKRALVTAGGVHRSNGGDSGSSSVPVSRAGSVSRVGTPQPSNVTTPFSPGYSNLGGLAPNHNNHGGNNSCGPGVASPPLTPLTASVHHLGIQSQPHSPTHAGVQQPFPQHHVNHASPPIQGSPGTPVHTAGSPSASPSATAATIQQAQIAYHAQYAAEMQRRQFMQFQAQWNLSQQQGDVQGQTGAAYAVGMDAEYGVGAEAEVQEQFGAGVGEWGHQQH